MTTLSIYMYILLALFVHHAFALDCSNVTFVKREEWGARHPKTDCCTLLDLPLPMVFLKHSSRGSCTTRHECIRLVKDIQDMHMDDKGWDDVGYNFMVGDDGRVYVGRGWTNEAAHTRSHNHLGYGICILGDYEIEAPSAKAMDVAYALVQCGIDKGYIDVDFEMISNTTALDNAWNKTLVSYGILYYRGGVITTENAASTTENHALYMILMMFTALLIQKYIYQ